MRTQSGGYTVNRVDMLRAKGVRAAIFDSSVNIRYLTGYTGEGCLLVLPEASVIVTDFRYIEQAERQSPECQIERTGNGRTRFSIVAERLKAAGIREVMVEEKVLSVAEYRGIQSALEGITLKDIPDYVEEMRAVKDEDEIECIKKALQISCEAFSDLLGFLKPGVTEMRAAAELDYRMRVHGSEGNAFNTIVASGVNGSLPHAIPSAKEIQSGDLVTFDFGAKFGGYCADMTRTIAVGQISDELRKIYDAVLDAQLRSLDAVRPGAVCRDIDKVARDLLESKYPGAFGHSLGHGVGLFIHEKPNLSFRCDTILTKGHVVTVEPGVYVPGVGGCRIEDTVIITEDGFINPVTTPKQLIVV